MRSNEKRRLVGDVAVVVVLVDGRHLLDEALDGAVVLNGLVDPPVGFFGQLRFFIDNLPRSSAENLIQALVSILVVRTNIAATLVSLLHFI